MGTPSSEEEERILKDLPPFLSDAMNYAKGMGDPRVIKTHLPVAMLNPDIFENSKGKWHRALSKMNSAIFSLTPITNYSCLCLPQPEGYVRLVFPSLSGSFLRTTG